MAQVLDQKRLTNATSAEAFPSGFGAQAAPRSEPTLPSASVTLGDGAAGVMGGAGGEAENYRQNQGNAALSQHFRARRPRHPQQRGGETPGRFGSISRRTPVPSGPVASGALQRSQQEPFSPQRTWKGTNTCRSQKDGAFHTLGETAQAIPLVVGAGLNTLSSEL